MKNLMRIYENNDFNISNPAKADLLSNTFVKKVKVYPKERKLDIFLTSSMSLSEDTLKTIERTIITNIVYCNRIQIHFEKARPDNPEKLIKENWDGLLEHIFQIIPGARMWLLDCDWEVRGNELNITIEKGGKEFLSCKKCKKIISQFFKGLGLTLKIDFKEEGNNLQNNILEEDRKIVQSILNDVVGIKEKVNFNHNNPVILGKLIKDETVLIKSITGEINDVIIEGEVFNLDTRQLRSKNFLISFGLTDFTGSIVVKMFLSDKNKGLLDSFNNGMWLKIRGKVEKNNYSQEYEIIPKDINIVEKPTREDNWPNKRVELHLHTRFSSMDALCSPTEVLKLAKDFGHKAVAFTDHGIVQAFPEVHEASKKIGIKPIYGLEAYVFDDINPIMYDPPKKEISDAVFVVVDIETTGLCFDDDEIIEIGAVKIKDGKVIDKFSSFIKPRRSLPANIIALTGITNEMLITAPYIEEVMPKFIDFIDDSIFVAHNADFDAGFIRRECKKLDLEFNNKVLDTLSLSKVLLNKLKNHKLATISKEFNIRMGNHHRALDDANTAYLILERLLRELKKLGITDISDINDAYKLSKNEIRLNTYHTTIFVKNQEGMKNLYKLVSKSHLEYFYRHPRIPKSLLNSYRDGLIIGTGCQAGELYQSIFKYKSDDEIKALTSFYDVFEIQPLSNNDFMIKKRLVSGVDRLKEINLQIYALGKEYNKPVILTGDVHFLNPRDAIYRKILQSGQGYRDFDLDSNLYFKTTEEMIKDANYLGEKAAFEVTVSNTNYIADLIEDDVKPIPDGLYPPKIDNAEDEIIQMAFQKAKELYGEPLPQIVQERLEKELNAIVSNGYAVIYLIAHKLVVKSLKDGYLVGSRGSVGSSLAATMCDITEVNPLPPHYRCPKCKNTIFVKDSEGLVGPDLPEKRCPNCGSDFVKDGFNIPFEVFLGFEGDKVPDIDLNFSGEYQQRAHKYTEELFGSNHVFRAGTISTIAEKTAYGFVKAYLEDKGIETSEIETKRLASGITGVKRTTGQHPGGVMVVPMDKNIYDFTPIQYPANDKKSSVITTHFDYHSISSRLLKLDLLGHDDPTSIKMLEELTGVDAKEIPLDDKDTMSIFSSLDSLNLDPESIGTTVGSLGVPEFGTRFVRQMLEDTRPKTFTELVRISGLSHGTDVWLNNAQDLIKRDVATLKDVIATRDDIMIYLINRGVEPKIAFSIMEKVRKGKGLLPEEEKLLSETPGIDRWFIDSCNKIKYLFPKAHAVAYVIMAFRIAFFKVHYPEAFYATYFSTRSDDFDAEIVLQGPDKVKDVMREIAKKDRDASVKERSLFSVLEVVNEMFMRGINFAPINLYKSDTKRFKVTKDGIMPPMTGLQGIGVTAAKNIARERKKTQFTSIEDLRRRTGITKNVIQILKQNRVLEGLQETDQISLF